MPHKSQGGWRLQRKAEKYHSLLQTHWFAPLCIATTGVVGPKSMALLQDVGHRIKEATGDPCSTDYLMQWLSVAVQRRNSASVLGGITT